MENKIEELKNKINYYDKKYYEEGISEISDAEYDRLYQELLDLETKCPELISKDSPTKKVGAGKEAGTTSSLPKFTHKTPLLSIDRKAKELAELKDFYEKIGGDGTEVIIEPKFDGITCNINFENGKLVNAATRGNGYIGDLITENFKNTETVYPDTIDRDIEIRGEAIIPYAFFKKNLAKDYSNPRNAVAGIMRQIDAEEVKNKGVHVLFYDIGQISKNIGTLYFENNEDFKEGIIKKDADQVMLIRDLGFDYSPFIIVNNWNDIKHIVESKFEGMIKDIDGFNVLSGYPDIPDAVCDGLVIKVNDLALRNEIGSSEKGPKWAFAYKFKPLQAITTIDYIDWQVGKTGKVTPVANFKEISLGGIKITRATLNNYDYMTHLPTVKANDELNLDKTTSVEQGDTIIVERSNDVIPRIVAVKEKLGPYAFEPQCIEIQQEIRRKEATFKEPQVCPICGHKLIKVGPLHFCKNYDCPQQIKRRLEHFASRDAMNIVGLGESVCDQLYEKLGVSHLEEIYNLKEDELIQIDAFKDKKTTNLLKAINASKNPELWRFIYSLSIDNVGKKTAKDLAKRYLTIENFKKATKEELLKIEDIGDIVADNIIDYLNNHIKDIDYLLDYVEPKNVNVSGNKLAGKTFVITGTLENPRSYYQEKIEALGGKISNSVSKKTNYVLVGKDAGSKEEKARKLIKEGALINLLNKEEDIRKILS